MARTATKTTAKATNNNSNNNDCSNMSDSVFYQKTILSFSTNMNHDSYHACYSISQHLQSVLRSGGEKERNKPRRKPTAPSPTPLLATLAVTTLPLSSSLLLTYPTLNSWYPPLSPFPPFKILPPAPPPI